MRYVQIEGVAILTMNRPDRLNALSGAMLTAFGQHGPYAAQRGYDMLAFAVSSGWHGTAERDTALAGRSIPRTQWPWRGTARARPGIDEVVIELATTDTFETDSGVGGSRVTHTGGRAAYHAAEKLKEQIAAGSRRCTRRGSSGRATT